MNHSTQIALRHHLLVQLVFVAHQGHGSGWYQLGGRTRPLRTAPRMIEIYEGGLTFDHCRWQGEPGRSVLIEFTDAHVQADTLAPHGIPTRTFGHKSGTLS